MMGMNILYEVEVVVVVDDVDVVVVVADNIVFGDKCLVMV